MNAWLLLSVAIEASLMEENWVEFEWHLPQFLTLFMDKVVGEE